MLIKVNEESLPQIQEALLCAVAELHKFFSEINVEYWIDFGSLLGAYRETKIIPWDDDFDVTIFEEDRELVINKLRERCSNLFEVRTFADTPSLMVPIKCVLKGTKVSISSLESRGVSEEIHYGVSIDIFTVEPLAESKLRRKMNVLLYKIIRSAKLARNIDLKRISSTAFSRKIAIVFLRLLPQHTIERLATNRRNSAGSDQELVYTAQSPFYERILKKEDILPLGLVKMNGGSFFAPQNVKSVLTKHYGENFMVPSRVGYEYSHYDWIELEEDSPFFKFFSRT